MALFNSVQERRDLSHQAFVLARCDMTDGSKNTVTADCTLPLALRIIRSSRVDLNMRVHQRSRSSISPASGFKLPAPRVGAPFGRRCLYVPLRRVGSRLKIRPRPAANRGTMSSR